MNRNGKFPERDVVPYLLLREDPGGAELALGRGNNFLDTLNGIVVLIYIITPEHTRGT